MKEETIRSIFDTFQEVWSKTDPEEFKHWMRNPRNVEILMKDFGYTPQLTGLYVDSRSEEFIYYLEDGYTLDLLYKKPDLLLEVRSPDSRDVKVVKFSKSNT